MPVNKNQLGRLLVIHGKLATGRKFNWEQLADACEFSDLVNERPAKRTIQDDIKLLQETFKAPIPKWKPHYYYEKEFALFNVLDHEDAALLNESLALLRQFASLPQSDGLQEVILKLESEAGLRAETPHTIVFFEQNTQLKGLTFINELYNYLNCQRCVHIEYKDFREESHTFVIHPYFLKEYNNRWYLFGLDHIRQQVFNLALDRIEAIFPSSATYQPNDQLDPNTYFEDIIGVTKPTNTKSELVKLRVWKPRAWYVDTKPLHTTQKLTFSTDEWMDFELSLIINKELESKILELGADCEVLEPAALREQIREIVKIMRKRYALN
jgi:predicted DNA-binding transcriptional regulator YafY